MNIDRFYLGIHHPNWLWHEDNQGVPMFPSHSSLRMRKTRFPRATVRTYAVDSGGFTQLQQHGTWTISPTEYVASLQRYWDELGPFEWAAQQDWMCEEEVRLGGWWRGGVQLAPRGAPEPAVRGRKPLYFAGTGLSVAQHQDLSDRNYHDLTDLTDLPILYVLQGQRVEDYLRHRDLAASRGIDLTTHPVVGVGSICRRQDTGEAGLILAALRREGIERAHTFGMKQDGLIKHHHLVWSADSQAGSFGGRFYRGPGTACGTVHKSHRGRPPARSCANCLPHSLRWRNQLVRRVGLQPVQAELFEVTP